MDAHRKSSVVIGVIVALHTTGVAFLIALIGWPDTLGPLLINPISFTVGVGCSLIGPPTVWWVQRRWERSRPGLAVGQPGTVRDLPSELARTTLPRWHDSARKDGLRLPVSRPEAELLVLRSVGIAALLGPHGEHRAAAFVVPAWPERGRAEAVSAWAQWLPTVGIDDLPPEAREDLSLAPLRSLPEADQARAFAAVAHAEKLLGMLWRYKTARRIGTALPATAVRTVGPDPTITAARDHPELLDFAADIFRDQATAAHRDNGPATAARQEERTIQICEALVERDGDSRLPRLAAATTRRVRWLAEEVRRVAALPENNGYGPPDHHNRRVPRFLRTVEWRRRKMEELLPLAEEPAALHRRHSADPVHGSGPARGLREALELYSEIAAAAGRSTGAGSAT